MTDLFLVSLSLIEPEDLKTILKDEYKEIMTGFYTIFFDENKHEYELIITITPIIDEDGISFTYGCFAEKELSDKLCNLIVDKIDEIVSGIVTSLNKFVEQM